VAQHNIAAVAPSENNLDMLVVGSDGALGQRRGVAVSRDWSWGNDSLCAGKAVRGRDRKRPSYFDLHSPRHLLTVHRNSRRRRLRRLRGTPYMPRAYCDLDFCNED
jgi:hypothetical protein